MDDTQLEEGIVEQPVMEEKRKKKRRTKEAVKEVPIPTEEVEETPAAVTPLDAKNNCLKGIKDAIGGLGRPKIVITYEPTPDTTEKKTFEHEPSEAPNVLLQEEQVGSSNVEAPQVGSQILQVEEGNPESTATSYDTYPSDKCKHPLKNGPCGKKVYACGYCSKHYEKHTEDDEDVAERVLSKGSETLFLAEYMGFGIVDKILLSRGYIPNNDTLAKKFYDDRERFMDLNNDLCAKYGASETLRYLSDPAFTLPAACVMMVLGHVGGDTHFEDKETESGKEKIMKKAVEEGYVPPFNEDEKTKVPVGSVDPGFLPGISV